MEHPYRGEEKFLVNDLKTIVSKARNKAFAAVNYSLVERNWRIGKRIVEEEQNGTARAEYGKHIIEVASAALTEEFGKGFSETNIINFKKFFLLFKDLGIPQTVSEELHLLPWSHYERLIRIEDKQAREWYAKEAFEQGWSYRTLNRNMYLQMYDKTKKGLDDNPTIGIILCAETDSDVARYSTLAKNDQMFAAKYKLYLPNEEDLRREIERQKELYLMAHPDK